MFIIKKGPFGRLEGSDGGRAQDRTVGDARLAFRIRKVRTDRGIGANQIGARCCSARKLPHSPVESRMLKCKNREIDHK